MTVGQVQQPVPAGQHPAAFIGKLREIYLFHNQLVYVFQAINLNESKTQLIQFIFLYHFI